MHGEKSGRLSLNLICKATQTGHKAKLYDTRGDVLHRFFHPHPDTQSCKWPESASQLITHFFCTQYRQALSVCLTVLTYSGLSNTGNKSEVHADIMQNITQLIFRQWSKASRQTCEMNSSAQSLIIFTLTNQFQCDLHRWY